VLEKNASFDIGGACCLLAGKNPTDLLHEIAFPPHVPGNRSQIFMGFTGMSTPASATR
jgi:hypothetical protein